jgi:hypothetical protein
MCQVPVFRLGDHVADALGRELLQYHWMHDVLLDPLRGWSCGFLRAVDMPREDLAAQTPPGQLTGVNDVGSRVPGRSGMRRELLGCGAPPANAGLSHKRSPSGLGQAAGVAGCPRASRLSC